MVGLAALPAQACRTRWSKRSSYLGFVILRLTQAGLPGRWAVVISALVRATYHLYQGFGGSVGNP